MLQDLSSSLPAADSASAPVDLLDELVLEVLPAPPAAPQRGVIKKINYSHDAMIDLIIAQPGISQNELATRFGYTASWICQVMASDAFQAKFASRRKEIVDPLLIDSVEVNFEALVRRSQEILLEKLSGPAKDIPPQLALRTMEVASRAAGYGARDPAPAAPQEVHNHLHLLGGNLVNLLRKAKVEAGHTLEGSICEENITP